MNMKRFFASNLSFRRLVLLAKKDVVETYRQGTVIFGAVFAVFLIIYLIAMYVLTRNGGIQFELSLGENTPDAHLGMFAPLIFLGGFIVTSRGFYEAHSRIRNHSWFMLPASPLEKFTERLVLTSVGYVLLATIGYTLFSMIAAGVSEILFRTSYPIFNPLRREPLMLMLNYLVLQSVFLFGAVYFRKNHFVKTVLVLIGFGIVLGILAAVTFRIVYWDYFKGGVPTADLGALFEGLDRWRPTLRLERIGERLETTFEVIYWALFAPVLWLMGFFRLRETEVKDGV